MCEDIADRLETVGYMKELKRTQVGEFYIKDSIEVSDLENDIDNKIITIEKLFEEKNSITLTQKKLEKFLNGVKLSVDEQNGLYKIYDFNNKFIGIGIIENNSLKRDIIL